MKPTALSNPAAVAGLALLSLISVWAGVPALAATTPAPVYATGQQHCYDSSGVQIFCTGTGQDGDTLAGAVWPSPRFLDNHDGSITDTLTGLQWTKDANAPGPSACTQRGVPMNWRDSLLYVKCLNSNTFLGRSDWRLPNVKELRSLFNGDEPTQSTWLMNNGFTNVQSGSYKSSTAGVGSNQNFPWVVSMFDGSLQPIIYTSINYVWPVRTDSPGGVTVPATGQTLCFDFVSGRTDSSVSCAGTGQDGETRNGVAWPTPRFTVNTSTIVDNLTALEWARDGVSQNLGLCVGGAVTWGRGGEFVSCLNTISYQGHNDWRMPSINELLSLSNGAQQDPYTWLTNIGFNLAPGTTSPSSPYWSSSTYMLNTARAWTILLKQAGGSTSHSSKLQEVNYVLPVRSATSSGGTNPPPTYKPGDVTQDGVVDVADALLVYRFYLGQNTPTQAQAGLADVAPLDGSFQPAGGNGIDLGDVVAILRYAVGAARW